MKSTETARAARCAGEADLWRRGNPGDTRRAHVGGDAETPGPAPFRRAAPQLPPRSLRASRKRKEPEGSLPRRSHSHRRRRLRSRHYRQLKRHMQLLFSGPGHPRARLPAAIPRDYKPVSRDSGRRWVAVARRLKGGETSGSMRVSLGGGAKQRRGRRPVGGARYPWEKMGGCGRSTDGEADGKRDPQ